MKPLTVNGKHFSHYQLYLVINLFWKYLIICCSQCENVFILVWSNTDSTAHVVKAGADLSSVYCIKKVHKHVLNHLFKLYSEKASYSWSARVGMPPVSNCVGCLDPSIPACRSNCLLLTAWTWVNTDFIVLNVSVAFYWFVWMYINRFKQCSQRKRRAFSAFGASNWLFYLVSLQRFIWLHTVEEEQPARMHYTDKNTHCFTFT